jgi:hypothetical protein
MSHIFEDLSTLFADSPCPGSSVLIFLCQRMPCNCDVKAKVAHNFHLKKRWSEFLYHKDGGIKSRDPIHEENCQFICPSCLIIERILLPDCFPLSSCVALFFFCSSAAVPPCLPWTGARGPISSYLTSCNSSAIACHHGGDEMCLWW